MSDLFSLLVLLAPCLSLSLTESDPATCIALHCALQGAACVVNADCLATLQVKYLCPPSSSTSLYRSA